MSLEQTRPLLPRWAEIALTTVAVVLGGPLCLLAWFLMIYESHGAAAVPHPGVVISSLLSGGLFGGLVGAPFAVSRGAGRVAWLTASVGAALGLVAGCLTPI